MVLLNESTPSPDGLDVEGTGVRRAGEWILPALQEEAAIAGLPVIAPAEVLATHLLEVLKSSLPRLLNLKTLRKLLDEFTNVSIQPALRRIGDFWTNSFRTRFQLNCY